jgi:hypothetical protein
MHITDSLSPSSESTECLPVKRTPLPIKPAKTKSIESAIKLIVHRPEISSISIILRVAIELENFSRQL